MLRWRLLLGTVIIGVLVGLGWLDHLVGIRNPAMRGMWLLPVAILFAVAASGEVLCLVKAGGMRPLAWAVYGGNLLLLASNWIPTLCCGTAGKTPQVAPIAWPFLAFAAGVLIVLAGEMRRYEKPGGVTVNAAAAVFGLAYVGVMLSFAVQLRLAPWGGVGALASLIVVAKVGDIGAYTIGRLIGRHKMAPVLSPGKTIEGALGALVFACLGAWLTFWWLIPAIRGVPQKPGPWWGWIAFGLMVGAMGLLGDLAESMLKRDAGRKDSSSWLPGFGGVLDILDSILVAAPVAWFCWATGLVGG